MDTVLESPALDINVKQKTEYAIPLWLRDEQIRANIARIPGRIEKHDLRPETIAIVCYGPSLNETWEQIRHYPFIMTCSGAHKFLIDRGIIPTHHIDVDPRKHKATLIGTPHRDVEYLMASTCHPEVFDLLEGFNVKLWHIFDSADEGFRILPPGEWALTGGPGAGLRAMCISRFLGFTKQHVFGMDGSDSPAGKHAGAHPMEAKKRSPVVYDGVTYYTTPAFLECAKATFHELDAMPDVQATFFGEGLVQHMARHYVPKPATVTPNIALSKPELISATAKELNARLHRENLAFGVGGGRHADVVLSLSKTLQTTSILDYGCGKGYLAKALPFPIWEYDPAIQGKDDSPRPADIVICTDVLEHVEDGKVQFVLGDIRRCLKRTGYFVIHMGPAGKTYADGRNTHLTQRSQTWWETKLAKYFEVAKVWRKGPELHVVVGPQRPPGTVTPGKHATMASNVVPIVAPSAPLLRFDDLRVETDPYPVGVSTNVLPPDLYAELARTFPPADKFQASTKRNKKLTLSEFSQAAEYHAVMATHPCWQRFHAYIKSPQFIARMLTLTKTQGMPVADPPEPGGFSSRFEFSLLPADGGCLLPHTDIAEKAITVVLGFRSQPDDWNDDWGGGTLILEPKAGVIAEDYTAPLELFHVRRTMPYHSNQAVVFVKSATSWHAVGPLTGPAGPMRRTVTINIEYAAAAERRRQTLLQVKA
jgi:hypothetical protein